MNIPKGFDREDLECVVDSLLNGYDRTVNVGNVTGVGDELLESTTAYAAKFIQAVIDSSSEDSVKIPTSPEEAELMAKLGMVWLQQNAPDRLKIYSNKTPMHEAEAVYFFRKPGYTPWYETNEKDANGYYTRQGWSVRKLYTHPENDELKKAAEEAYQLCKRLGYDRIAENLREALKRNPNG